MVDVFISYRRKDSKETGEKTVPSLDVTWFRIFLDTEYIEAGNKWREVLETG